MSGTSYWRDASDGRLLVALSGLNAMGEAASRVAVARAGVRRRFAPLQLRHAHAVETSREGVALLVTQRQLGHADLAITSVRGIDNTEIVYAVHERPAQMIPATHGL